MLDIKPVKQSKNLCGPATLKMVFAYYGVDKPESYLARLSKADPNKGTKAENMVLAAEKLGFDAYFKDNCSLKELERLVKEESIPVIFNWFCQDGMGHYSVAVDLTKRYVYYVDPNIGKKDKLTRTNFLERWLDYYGNYPRDPEDFIIRRMIVIKENGIYRPKEGFSHKTKTN
jgi:ABC-type bacteriocin/lantibiotic exporter with double-glycine peptidase domain